MTKLLAVLLTALVACTTDHAAPPEGSLELAPPQGQPARTKIIGALGGVVNTGWTPDWSGYSGTSRGCMRSYSAGRYALELGLEEGDRMLSMAVAAVGNWSADLEVWAVSAQPDGQNAPPAVAFVVPNVSGDKFTDFVIDLPDTLVTGGVAHWLELVADQAGLCVGAVRLIYDRPSG